jgi:putative restriction endonuclease
VLDAAHIRPYNQGGEHRIDNGLFLRSDLHRLFDLGYVTVTPDHKFVVGDRLGEEYKNGRTYYALSGSRIRLPENPLWLPNQDALTWHQESLFRG